MVSFFSHGFASGGESSKKGKSQNATQYGTALRAGSSSSIAKPGALCGLFLVIMVIRPCREAVQRADLHPSFARCQIVFVEIACCSPLFFLCLVLLHNATPRTLDSERYHRSSQGLLSSLGRSCNLAFLSRADCNYVDYVLCAHHVV